jgi:hypothetical protein
VYAVVEALFFAVCCVGAILLLIVGVASQRDGLAIAGAILLASVLLIQNGMPQGRQNRS